MSNKVFNRHNKIIFFLLGLALAFPFCGIIASYLRLWHEKGVIIIPSGTYTLIISALSILILLYYKLIKKTKLNFKYAPYLLLAFSYCLILLFFSDFINRGENFFKGPTIRGEVILLGALSLIALHYFKESYLKLIAITTLICLPIYFYSELKGQQLFSDDHATFYYRLKLLFEQFPNIPFFNPLWNGGIDERAFFATGSLNIFFISYPLLSIIPLEKAYNIIITFLGFIFPILSIYIACRIFKFNTRITAIAVILISCTDISWFQWLLTYGTLGFITSLLFFPIVFALACKVIIQSFEDKFDSIKELTFFQFVSLVILTSLMLFWSPMGLVFLPVFLIAIFKFSKIIKQKYILFSIIALLFINIPWIYTFWNVSKVSSFVISEKEKKIDDELKTSLAKRKFKHRTGKIDFKKSINLFRSHSNNINPLLLILGLPGIFFLGKRKSVIFALTGIWLIFLGSFLVPVKPQLEFDRMLLVLSFLLVFPTAKSIDLLLKLKDDGAKNFSKVFSCIPLIFILGFLTLTPLMSAAVIKKRAAYGFGTQTDFAPELSNFIKNRKKSGRILFSGCLVQEFDGGHFAPLSVMSEKPLIASSPVGNIWWYTDVFPEEYRMPVDNRETYLNLMNVTGVFAHEPKYRDYFLKNKNYRKVWSKDSFFFFERLNYKNNYFYQGNGKILSQNNSEVKFITNSKDAILKFTWFPFVEVKGCNIYEAKITKDISFIGLKNCTPNLELILKSSNLYNRLFNKK